MSGWVRGFLGFLVIGAASCAGPSGPASPRAVDGRLDLTGPGALDTPVALDGEWDFYYRNLLAPGDRRTGRGSITFPEALWFDGNTGWATYRLVVVLPEPPPTLDLRIPEAFSSLRLYVNGTEAFAAGVPATTALAGRSALGTGVVRFEGRGGENEILVQVANFAERRGGMNRSFVLGEVTATVNGYFQAAAADLLAFGLLFGMGAYHLILFSLRRKDFSSLWFGLFCLAIALRTLLYGERLLFHLVPGLPWEVYQVADHLTFYLGFPAFAEYLRHSLPGTISVRFVRLYQLLGVIAAAFLVFPPEVFNLTVVGYEIVSALAAGHLVMTLVRSVVRRAPGALLTLGGVGLFLVLAVNEALHNLGWVHTFNSLSLGLVVFLGSQAILLARRTARAFAESERLGTELLETNRALRRFIPEEFFQVLGAQSVTDIRLGDQVRRPMSVMFSDIRGFTALAENLSSEETFHFLNSYYSRAGLVMRQHGGFIDKYFGDGFMTLFPNRTDDALSAAVDLQRALVEYNHHRARSGYRPIAVGSGIHQGRLVLGTIGEPHRMDTTVIADAVNLASRLESLTKMYGPGTIVTLGFLDSLEEPDRFHWRYLGLLRVSGRQEPVEAVHVYDGLAPDDWERFETGKKAFEEALALYRQGDFAAAEGAFQDLAARDPADPAIATYLGRITLLRKAGLDDWDGVDTILTK